MLKKIIVKIYLLTAKIGGSYVLMKKEHKASYL
jgi:hypothetical protein